MATKIDYSSYVDTKYKDFTSALSPEVKLPYIGIRIPDLKKLAKTLPFTEIEINYNDDVLLQGLMICYLKASFNKKKELIERLYIPIITGWASTDIFASNNKFKKEEEKDYYNYYISLLYREEALTKRLGVVCLLSSFLNKEEYLIETLERISNIKTEDYLLRMAIAWYMASSFTKYPELSLPYFHNLDKTTLKMAKQKCRDSSRVSAENKALVSAL